MNTTEVENYPGFREGIMGPALMDEMRAQAERFGAELITDDVTELRLEGPVKVVVDSEGTEYRARTVILAMGSAYKRLGLPDEDRLSGRGVSWCATCDGFFFRDKPIVSRWCTAATSSARRRSCRPAPWRTPSSPWPGTPR